MGLRGLDRKEATFLGPAENVEYGNLYVRAEPPRQRVRRTLQSVIPYRQALLVLPRVAGGPAGQGHSQWYAVGGAQQGQCTEAPDFQGGSTIGDVGHPEQLTEVEGRGEPLLCSLTVSGL